MSQDSKHTFAIGDVHGCAELLDNLLDAIRTKALQESLDYRVVFLGDIIDRGPDSRAAMDLVIATLRDVPGSKLILGNHESLLLRAIRGDDFAIYSWRTQGGDETLCSYGMTGGAPVTSESIHDTIGAEHLACMAAAEHYVELEHHILVHAGVRSGIAIENQTHHDLMWIRDGFIDCVESFGAFQTRRAGLRHGTLPTIRLSTGETAMTFRKICIYGAGALGGAIAAKFSSGLAGQAEVSAVARGVHLARMRENGLTIIEDDVDEPEVHRLAATDDPRELGAQDLVVTGLKGHQLAVAAEGIATLLKPETRVVMILNGIPWWYFHGDPDTARTGTRLEALDPGGVLWRLIGPERVIGCVAYQGGEVVEPGMIHLYHKKRLILGEPDGSASTDIETVAALLNRCGLVGEATQDIRAEIWTKLMNNAAFNPVSALTRATMVPLLSDPAIVATMGDIMREVKAVAAAFGVHLTIDVDQRLEDSRAIPDVRTSMLQDLLAGRPLEIVPVLGAVIELGRMADVPVPTCRTTYALTVRLDEENRRST